MTGLSVRRLFRLSRWNERARAEPRMTRTRSTLPPWVSVGGVDDRTRETTADCLEARAHACVGFGAGRSDGRALANRGEGRKGEDVTPPRPGGLSPHLPPPVYYGAGAEQG